jgi:hypothetical protein
MNVTKNEMTVLAAIRDSEYNDGDRLNPVWVDCIWGWSGTKTFSGVMSSLNKKGLVVSDDVTVTLTEIGLEAAGPFVSQRKDIGSKAAKSIKAQAKVGKAALQAMAADATIETKTSKAIAILHHDPKPEAYIGLKTIAASPWQQLAIEIALEALSAKAGSLDAESADALLDMVRNSYRIEFVLKA